MTYRLLSLFALSMAAVAVWLAPRVLASPGGGASAEESSTAASNAAGRPIPVEVTPAVKQDRYTRTRRYTGSFVAARESRLAFERPGRIVRLLVDEGDAVAADQPLAELDRRHLNARRRQLVAQLGEAEAVLDELVAGPRKERIAEAEAEVRSLAAQRDSAELNLERRRRLVDTRAVSREEFDDVQHQFQATAARVDAAQQRLDELLAGTRVEQVAAQRSRVERLAAELADLDHDLEDTVLRAPYAGAIAERLLDDGAIVSSGDPVFKLIDRATPELWVGLPAAVAARLEPGATLAADVAGGAATATVRSLRPELDPSTRTRNVVFTLDAKGAVPGQIGRIAAEESVAAVGCWAPTDALTPRKRGLWAVYVAEGDGRERTVAARDVEVLHTDGDRSFVRGALAPGDAIIATGAHRVVEGQRVTVEPAE